MTNAGFIPACGIVLGNASSHGAALNVSSSSVATRRIVEEGHASFASTQKARLTKKWRFSAHDSNVVASSGCSSKSSSFFSKAVSAKGSGSFSKVVPISPVVRASSAVAEDVAKPSSPSPEENVAGRFDFIIVGGGAAGCVIANRLSENPNTSVLMLEAGFDETPIYVDVPIGFPFVFGSKCDWGFKSENEPKAGNRRIYLPRGRMIGGSHAISVALYQRGDACDYDFWERLGNAKWGSRDVLPYFIRSEKNERGASEFHGDKGPLTIADGRLAPVSRAFLEAIEEVGLKPNDDFNDWSQEGFGRFQVFQKRGHRVHPGKAYLDPVRERSNLTVQVHATVNRVIFRGNRAVGVSYIVDGQEFKAYSNNEVIMTAGSVSTPMVLMRSGVGPADHLSELGIPVVADLPGVGQNLQDHPTFLAGYDAPNGGTYSSSTPYSIPTLLAYLLLGKGPLRTTVCEAGGFVKTQPGLESADVQVRFVPFRSDYDDPYASFGDYRQGGQSWLRSKKVKDGMTIQVVAIRAQSRGYIKLSSTDPLAPPVIKTNYLDDERDVKSLVEGMKLVRKIMAAKAFDRYRGVEMFPGHNVQTDEDIAAYARRTVHTANALVGTCKMGPASDPLAVVDSDLKVYGVEGLRIIDSSIMPRVPGGQTGAPTFMIAEKGADLLKETWAADAAVAQEVATV